MRGHAWSLSTGTLCCDPRLTFKAGSGTCTKADFRGRRDPEYFRLDTLFLLAELLGWLEIIRREMQFLDLGAIDTTKNLGLKISRVEGLLASTGRSLRDECYVYRGQQRSIGELMLNRVNWDPAGRRHECMGYAAFVAAQSDPQFARWFTRLGD